MNVLAIQCGRVRKASVPSGRRYRGPRGRSSKRSCRIMSEVGPLVVGIRSRRNEPPSPPVKSGLTRRTSRPSLVAPTPAICIRTPPRGQPQRAALLPATPGPANRMCMRPRRGAAAGRALREATARPSEAGSGERSRGGCKRPEGGGRTRSSRRPVVSARSRLPKRVSVLGLWTTEWCADRRWPGSPAIVGHERRR